MASLIQDIQYIRSLRKDIRDHKIPTNILNSIGSIHNCIKSGTDLNGWKKVEWRGGNNNNNSHYRPHHDTQHHGHSHNNNNNKSSNDNFFINRHGNRNDSVYTFGGRSKGGLNSKQTSEQSVSIPLSSNTNITNNTSPTTNSCNANSDGFRFPAHKYVSKFIKTSEKVEDTILNTIILGKLNKFSEQNYHEIKEFITHIIDSGQNDMIKCFMKLVFEKAASEEIFCPLYAKLLSELSSRYPLLLTEMANLYSEYMEVFEEVSQNDAENYNEVCKRNIEKKYRRGYSQFLAELIKHNVFDTDIFIKTLNKIITQVEANILNKDSIKLNEEYADCIMKIMKAIQNDNNCVEISCEDNFDLISDSDSDSDSLSDIDTNSINNKENNDKIKLNNIDTIRKVLKNDTYNRIEKLTIRNTQNIGLSNKSRFTFLDIYEGIQKF
jgi:hypothetical protein